MKGWKGERLVKRWVFQSSFFPSVFKNTICNWILQRFLILIWRHIFTLNYLFSYSLIIITLIYRQHIASRININACWRCQTGFIESQIILKSICDHRLHQLYGKARTWSFIIYFRSPLLEIQFSGMFGHKFLMRSVIISWKSMKTNEKLYRSNICFALALVNWNQSEIYFSICFLCKQHLGNLS